MYRFWQAPLQALAMVAVTMVTAAVAAAELSNYGLQAAIYQWYGDLDTANAGMEMSHHLLFIGPPRYSTSEELTRVEVEVRLESQEQRIGQSHYPGHYEEHILHISSALDQVLASQTLVYSLDDFDSKYRPSRAGNLIKGLIYSWTHSLDTYDSQTLQQHMLANSAFIAAEPQVQHVEDYIPYLQSFNYLKNHRDLSKLSIEMLNINQDTYQVSYEFQWWAVNQQGESELARMAVEMQVQIIAGRAMISLY